MKSWYKVYSYAAILGAVMFAVLYYVQPVMWKGEGLIRIGSLSAGTNPPLLIEPVATVLERMKSLSFAIAVSEKAQKEELVDLLSVEKNAALSVKPIRNGDSILVTIVGNSPSEVKIALAAVSVPGEFCAGVPAEIWSGAKAGFRIAS